MVALAKKNSALSVSAIRDLLLLEARAIHNEDIEMCRSISEFGLTLVKDGDGILTHCNAGPLATSLPPELPSVPFFSAPSAG